MKRMKSTRSVSVSGRQELPRQYLNPDVHMYIYRHTYKHTYRSTCTHKHFSKKDTEVKMLAKLSDFKSAVNRRVPLGSKHGFINALGDITAKFLLILMIVLPISFIWWGNNCRLQYNVLLLLQLAHYCQVSFSLSLFLCLCLSLARSLSLALPSLSLSLPPPLSLSLPPPLSLSLPPSLSLSLSLFLSLLFSS